jgi:nucleoside-diphosphate-sugar epimerase
LEVGERVLVTGHHGYLGTVIAPMLQRAGFDVVGLDCDYFRSCLLGPEPPSIPSVTADIRDVAPAHLSGVRAVVHLAALSNDPLGSLDPKQTDDINHKATIRLARAAREVGVRRFLYSSSCSIYGASGGDDLVAEDAPLRPITAYAVSKVRAEQDLHDLADDDFSPVYLRNATAYGFSPRLRTDLVLNNLVAWAHLTREVKVLSDGTPWRPIVHALDIGAAFVAALGAQRDAVHDQAFNVGRAEENYRVREIAQIVTDLVPGCRLVITGETGADPRSYRVDFSKIARQLPAFTPAWDARLGTKELCEAYLRFGMTKEGFERSFTRLAWLSHLREQGQLDARLRSVS